MDGYVTLDPEGRLGLGAYVAEWTGLPVIGVAKSAFRSATHAEKVIRVLKSTRPLYVTSRGLESSEAAHIVGLMSGLRRIPDMLARADRLARGIIEPEKGRF